ncbi:MAG TPA: alpha/beta hydrolase [Nitriliruptorales bacterium]|nr:alpha/beta hydrolase [Nitriliruptorales bacterium]
MSGSVPSLAGATRGALRALQRHLLYLPGPAPPDIERVLPGGEEVVLRTADGLDLSAWYLPSERGDGAAALVLHGNGGNRAGRAPLARALAQRGVAVLLVDYRGYGGNPGRPAEDGLLADARAGRAALLARHDVDPARIVYLGESLGAAVATALAADAPPAALVLRSPFTSLADVARVHYPWFPSSLLVERYGSLDLIGRVTAPVLVVAGERDRIVPFAQSRRVCDAAREPKRFVAVSGADHNDIALLAGDRLVEAVAQHLTEHGILRQDPDG